MRNSPVPRLAPVRPSIHSPRASGVEDTRAPQIWITCGWKPFLLGMLFLLSEAIEVPKRDTQAGKMTITRSETGELFDWRQVTGDLLRVRLSPKGLWAQLPPCVSRQLVYIDDVDLMSKSIFYCYLNSLPASGKNEGMLPILTVPIGK